ncbi:MAG: beta/gamma crystallin family protein [Terricaulis sp.]
MSLGTLAVMALTVTALAQSGSGANPPCQITTTTSTGPNGETITRREGCGGVEITSSGGHQNSAPSTPGATTHSNSSSSNTTHWGDTQTQTHSSTSSTTTTGPGHSETVTHSSSTTMTLPSAPSMSPPSMPPPPIQAPGSPNWTPGASFPPPNNGPFGDIPQPPPDFARIVLFDNADFRGHSIGITQDTPNLQSRHFDKRASSVQLQGGRWQLCSEPNYGGHCIVVDENTDLAAAQMGDMVSSVRRIRP